jgi:galactokinase
MTGPGVADAFRVLTGHPPEGVWAAPGRVNLIGEHTDYNQGLVLPFAIEAGTDLAASRRDDGVVRVSSVQRPGDVVTADLATLSPITVEGWSAYVLGVVWALREDGHDLGGVDLVLDGRVPLGSGLSSSASLECATALAVADLHGLGLTRERLAALAQRAENDAVGAPTGPMDQRASMLCTAGHALLLDTRDMSTAQVPLDAAAAGLALLVVDSGVHHEHAGGEYGARRRSCEQACAELGIGALRDVDLDGLDDALGRLSSDELRRRVRHVVTEDGRTRAVVDALRGGDWDAVGAAMTASHASMRDDYQISCRELDALVAAALDAGALGARLTGGGFGGCAVVLASADAVDTVLSSVRRAFADHGYAEPTSFVALAAPGARRLR